MKRCTRFWMRRSRGWGWGRGRSYRTLFASRNLLSSCSVNGSAQETPLSGSSTFPSARAILISPHTERTAPSSSRNSDRASVGTRGTLAQRAEALRRLRAMSFSPIQGPLHGRSGSATYRRRNAIDSDSANRADGSNSARLGCDSVGIAGSVVVSSPSRTPQVPPMTNRAITTNPETATVSPAQRR